MAKRALTDAAVKKINPPKSGQADHFDSGYPGLALRVSYGGRKAWVYFYRFQGRQKRMTLGAYPSMSVADARDNWRTIREKIDAGINPAREVTEPETADIVRDVFSEWLKRDQSGNRSVNEVRRAFTVDILPKIGERDISDVGRRDILEILDAVTDRGAETLARRIHAYLHRFFRWALGRGYVKTNPLAELPKPGREVHRDRVLSDDELRALWKAANEMGWPFGKLFQLLILTGQRKSEVGNMEWKEVDGDTWTIPRERVKTDVAHIVPLSTQARELLDDLPQIGGRGYIFTTNGYKPVSGYSKGKLALDKKMAEFLPEGAKTEPWRLHDIRRTVASGMARLGINIAVIEKILNHTSGTFGGIVGIYQRHEFADEKRQALEAWGRFVETLVSETPATNVVELAGARFE